MTTLHSCSSASTCDDMERGRTRNRELHPRKRTKINMAVGDSLPAGLSQAPTFSPAGGLPSPETSPDDQRSPSRARSQISALANCGDPRVTIQSGDIEDDENDTARELWLRCCAVVSGKVIPEELRHAFRQDQYKEMFMLCGAIPCLSNNYHAKKLVRRVRQILRLARECEVNNKDENAWDEVVRLVLNTVVFNFCVDDELDQEKDLVVTDIQSQSIDPEFLPKIPASKGKAAYCDRKADFALGFSKKSEQHKQLAAALGNSSAAFSHMKDAHTSTIALVQPVEVKTPAGNLQEAQLQIAVFNTASLRFLSTRSSNKSKVLPPLPGWTVVGHTWNLLFTWVEADGTIVRTRILPMGRSLGTQNVEGLFQLFAALRLVIAWIREHYWDAFATLMKSTGHVQGAAESATLMKSTGQVQGGGAESGAVESVS